MRQTGFYQSYMGAWAEQQGGAMLLREQLLVKLRRVSSTRRRSVVSRSPAVGIEATFRRKRCMELKHIVCIAAAVGYVNPVYYKGHLASGFRMLPTA